MNEYENQVVKTEDYRSDNFTGTAEAIVAAGYARLDELPGQPGRGKMMCTYQLDGTPVPKGASGGQQGRKRQIRRAGKTRYCVSIDVDEEVADRRIDESKRLALRRRIQANSVTRFEVGKLARLCQDFGVNAGRIVRIVEKITDVEGRFQIPYGLEGMPIWRVRSEREPFVYDGGSRREIKVWDAGLQPIDHLRVIHGRHAEALNQPMPRPRTDAMSPRCHLRLL